MIKGIRELKHAQEYPGYNISEPKNLDELFEMVLEIITSAPVYYTAKNPFNGLPLLNLFVYNGK